MLCKFRNNQLKSHFFYKIPNIKKHVTFFENLIADLKSSRKNASETVFILMRSFHKYFNIGKLHCAPPPLQTPNGYSLSITNGYRKFQRPETTPCTVCPGREKTENANFFVSLCNIPYLRVLVL